VSISRLGLVGTNDEPTIPPSSQAINAKSDITKAPVMGIKFLLESFKGFRAMYFLLIFFPDTMIVICEFCRHV